jgi:hypothetical protein
LAAGLLALNAGAQTLDTKALLDDTETRALLEKKCVRTKTAGGVDVGFEQAVDMLSRPDSVQRVQEEYARSVSEDGKAAFPIVEDKPGAYHYVNAEGRRTDVVERYRGTSGEDRFDVVLQASGKRFFGRYDVVVHVRVVDAAESGSAYVAQIHAYPHNFFARFLARNLGLVERYFGRNTARIEQIAQKICAGLETGAADACPGGKKPAISKIPATQTDDSCDALKSESAHLAHFNTG